MPGCGPPSVDMNGVPLSRKDSLLAKENGSIDQGIVFFYIKLRRLLMFRDVYPSQTLTSHILQFLYKKTQKKKLLIVSPKKWTNVTTFNQKF